MRSLQILKNYTLTFIITLILLTMISCNSIKSNNTAIDKVEQVIKFVP